MAIETSSSDSERSAKFNGIGSKLPAWLKVGTIAGASAVAGGLAALWFYRKTLWQLQDAESLSDNSNFRISETEFQDGE